MSLDITSVYFTFVYCYYFAFTQRKFISKSYVQSRVMDIVLQGVPLRRDIVQSSASYPGCCGVYSSLRTCPKPSPVFTFCFRNQLNIVTLALYSIGPRIWFVSAACNARNLADFFHCVFYFLSHSQICNCLLLPALKFCSRLASRWYSWMMMMMMLMMIKITRPRLCCDQRRINLFFCQSSVFVVT